MFCSSCGLRMASAARFCARCGTPVEVDAGATIVGDEALLDANQETLGRVSARLNPNLYQPRNKNAGEETSPA